MGLGVRTNCPDYDLAEQTTAEKDYQPPGVDPPKGCGGGGGVEALI